MGELIRAAIRAGLDNPEQLSNFARQYRHLKMEARTSIDIPARTYNALRGLAIKSKTPIQTLITAAILSAFPNS